MFLFRDDLKEFQEGEWNGISETLALHQLENEIAISLSFAGYDKKRRSHKIKADSPNDLDKANSMIKQALEGKPYKIYIPSNRPATAEWITCVIPKTLSFLVNKGQLFKLIALTTNFGQNHIQMPVPPKELENGRFAIVVELSGDLSTYLLKKKTLCA